MPKPASVLSEVHRAVVSTEVGGEAGLGEPIGERHREAAGVRRRDELLGVGALALLEARLERVVPLVAALAGADGAGTLGEVPLPAGVSSTNRHVPDASPMSCVLAW